MKSIALVGPAFLFAVAALAVGSHAHAGDPPPIRIIPNVFFGGTVEGTIQVPTGPESDPRLAGIQCQNLHVSATSQDTKPGALFATPKWTTSTAATGTWSSGKCSYALTVNSNSNFMVTVSGGVNELKCWLVEPSVTPAQAGWFKVPILGSRTQNFSVKSLLCENPPG